MKVSLGQTLVEEAQNQTMAPPYDSPQRPVEVSDDEAEHDDDDDDNTQTSTPRPKLSGKRNESFLEKMFARKSPEEVRESANDAMYKRWGPSESLTYGMVQRYWQSQRIDGHWHTLYQTQPRKFIKYMKKGYMEPIPTTWVKNQFLAYPYPEGSAWENRAEKRLYYTLNSARLPDGSKPRYLKPLNMLRNRNEIIRRGNARNALQKPLSLEMVQRYGSPHDAFHSDKQIKTHDYSPQVQNNIYEARIAALHELADGINSGRDHLETMILVDVSGSMSWNPHGGITGPDGIRRFHDQPPNIVLVKSLVHRCLFHMIPRTQREHPSQKGIDLFTFSSFGKYLGEITTTNFERDWRSKINLGGGTRIMQGWQAVKNQFFKERHAENELWGRWDEVFGWQVTPNMPKLSLLVFLDGEANDMDEFELELLGESWAYVTIALVGMEMCPHHNAHAQELDRICQFNPHVGFFDVQGRVCERLFVQDLLSSVYPVDPPGYEEVTKPEYELPDYSPEFAGGTTVAKGKKFFQ